MTLILKRPTADGLVLSREIAQSIVYALFVCYEHCSEQMTVVPILFSLE